MRLDAPFKQYGEQTGQPETKSFPEAKELESAPFLTTRQGEKYLAEMITESNLSLDLFR